MPALRKRHLLLLILITASCADEVSDEFTGYADPCERLLDRIATCVGGRPPLRGTCDEDEAERLLDMTCEALIRNLRGE